MKKVVKIIVLCVVVFVVFIGVLVGKDLLMEKKLEKEIDSVYDLINKDKVDTKEVNKKLDRTVTTGEYKKIEKALKNYLKDVITTTDTLTSLLNDEKMTEVLSIENIKKDQKEFKESLAYLKETKDSLSSSFNQLKSLLEKDTMLSYFKKEKIDASYKEEYEELVQEEQEELKATQKELKTALEQINTLLDAEEKILILLKENPNSWKITNGQIEFYEQKLLDKYNSYYDEIAKISEE